ncbi:MAG: FAD binding domain-containing protein, partial [Bacteroidetes bacterium]|nr:FAD binding domain-containing protein [Bacteroidota bacterium]
MIRFILNNKLIRTDEPEGTSLLDFIRYGEHLTGTKIGCREGDCGACAVLVGTLRDGKMVYGQVTSCLTALGNVRDKHVVTVEGLEVRGASAGLNFLQRVVCEEGGTQCGFCTPGFIMSMAGFCLGDKEPTQAQALAAVDGNICRCTGYKSIERALGRVVELLRREGVEEGRMDFAIAEGIVPGWFAGIPRMLAELALEPNGIGGRGKGKKYLGGGTDLYVRDHVGVVRAELELLSGRPDLMGIREEAGCCVIGGAATVSDMMDSEIIRRVFPRFGEYARLISSTPIRNIATVAGNFVNASPIGDLSIFFLALDAQLILREGDERRELPLREFFKGYKLLDKSEGEYIEQIRFVVPSTEMRFHFEKVSKRTCLDIASVNSAMRVRVSGGRIVEGHLSAGGVSAVPAYLREASGVMSGRRVDAGLVAEVVDRAREEVTPISDVRGTAEYKRLLLGQLI